jgi:hypothetical protein
MKLDIRIPLGLLFVVFGGLLSAFGLASDNAIYERSLGIDVNLWWGAVMLVFGLAMLVLGRRAHRRAATASAASAAQPTGTSASKHQ